MHVILLADHAFAEGGAPQVAIASARALAEAGVEVTYLHGVGNLGSDALEHPRIRRIGLGGADIHAKTAVRALADGLWNREPLVRLRAILAQAPENVVLHVHQWTKYFSPSLFSVLRASRFPLVVSMHDYFSACPTGLMYRFDQSKPCALTPLSARCMLSPCDPKSMIHKGVRVLRTLAAIQALGKAALDIVHVSEVGRRTIAHHMPEQARHHVIENPIEVPRPSAARDGVGSQVVYCGRLTREKGAELVAEAARKAGLPALFIGDGPSAERIRLLNPQAEITGWLSRDTVRARLAEDARVLVAPSLWPETGPLVVAEAMALGVPTIVSDRAGASGRVQHGVTGLVVSPQADSIAHALERLLHEPVARDMGRAAFDTYWQSPPSPEAHAAALIRLYRAARQG
ncbi:RfaG Glycosyltransferase [Rhabdaerophilaceae bacterium]